MELVKELWQAAVTLRGAIEPAEYKRFVLPLIFLRYVSLRTERRRPGASTIPKQARWSELLTHAAEDDIKLPARRRPGGAGEGLPRQAAGPAAADLRRRPTSTPQNVTRLHQPVLARGLHARTTAARTCSAASTSTSSASSPSSEGKRGGEYFTPAQHREAARRHAGAARGASSSTRAAARAACSCSPTSSRKHSHELSFVGQESKEFTYRLCRMNLFIHGLEGEHRAWATPTPTTSTRR